MTSCACSEPGQKTFAQYFGDSPALSDDRPTLEYFAASPQHERDLLASAGQSTSSSCRSVRSTPPASNPAKAREPATP